MINEITNIHPSLKVIKKYPKSGQKQVYLVEIDEIGIVILKTVQKMDARIQREIDIVNKNSIPGVPRILELRKVVFEGEDRYYFIEEYIPGSSLDTLINQGPLDIKLCLVMLEDLLKTVVELEKIGIVHRDIKPDNIILGDDGHFHLIDFGIARNLNLSSLTATTAVVGPHTPGYGAPELFQYNKSIIDSRADLFSIGVVVYQSIFGEHPFLTGQEADLNEIWYRTATVTPDNYSIDCDEDGQLMGLISTMMQKQTSKRPPSAKKALEWYYLVQETLSV